MLRKAPELSPRQLRKQLLLAESELNRVQLLEDLKFVRGQFAQAHSTENSVQTFGAGFLWMVRNWIAWKHGEGLTRGTTVHWLLPVIRGAGAVASLWQAFRSRSPSKDAKP
jgi:hypothetical protein